MSLERKVFKIEIPANNPHYNHVMDKRVAVDNNFKWDDVNKFIAHEYLCLSKEQKEKVNSYWVQVIYPKNRTDRKYVQFGLGKDRTKRSYYRFDLVKGGSP